MYSICSVCYILYVVCVCIYGQNVYVYAVYLVHIYAYCIYMYIVLQIADQMLDRVDTLHSRHLIHRDIKPVREYGSYLVHTYTSIYIILVYCYLLSCMESDLCMVVSLCTYILCICTYY